MARKVARVHADQDPEGRLPEIRDSLLALKSELESHMDREVRGLFPRLLAADPEVPVAPYVDEHEQAGAALARLRELTDEYCPPADACNIKKVARMIKRHLEGILNAVVLGVTNARAEGLNAKIQWIKATARRFRNRERFRDAIYFHLGGLDLYHAPMAP